MLKKAKFGTFQSDKQTVLYFLEGNVYIWNVYGMYRKCRLTTHPHIPVVTCDKWPLSVVGAVGVVLLNLEEF